MNNTTTSTTPTLMAIDQPGCRINSDTPNLLKRYIARETYYLLRNQHRAIHQRATTA